MISVLSICYINITSTPLHSFEEQLLLGSEALVRHSHQVWLVKGLHFRREAAIHPDQVTPREGLSPLLQTKRCEIHCK